jgi:hypothetical protein
MRRSLALFAILAPVAALGACRQLAGIYEIEAIEAGAFDGPKRESGADARHHDSAPVEAAAADTGADAGPCGCEGCEILADNQLSPLSLVVIGTDIYFLNYGPGLDQGSIGHVSTTGGKVTKLLAGLTNPLGLTTDGKSLFFYAQSASMGGVIMKLSLPRPTGGTGAPEMLAVNQGTMSGLVLCQTVQFPTSNLIVATASDVYWIGATGGTNDSVMQVPIDGGATKPFVNNVSFEAGTATLQPVAIAADGTDLFVVTVGTGYVGVFSVPLGSGIVTPTPVIDGLTSPDDLALTATDVIISDQGINFTNGTLIEVPKTGGASKLLAHRLADPWNIVTDSKNVYWVNSGNSSMNAGIDSLPLAGGKPSPIVPFASGPVAIAQDSTNIYWADQSCGTIVKLAK